MALALAAAQKRRSELGQPGSNGPTPVVATPARAGKRQLPPKNVNTTSAIPAEQVTPDPKQSRVDGTPVEPPVEETTRVPVPTNPPGELFNKTKLSNLFLQKNVTIHHLL